MPTYWCANNLGFVPEHIYVAETEVIHRHLKPGEVVHHQNQNRLCNTPSNLIVFKTRSDHSRFHKGGRLVETEEPGVYTSEFYFPSIPCSYCGQMFEPHKKTAKYCCRECSILGQRKVDRPSKRQLKKLLLEFNVSQIAKIYGVSDNGVRRWLMSENLPHKLKDINKLRERERIKAEEKALAREMKERVIERDRAIKKNAE